jgi:hypothetical protein
VFTESLFTNSKSKSPNTHRIFAPRHGSTALPNKIASLSKTERIIVGSQLLG